MGALAVEVRGNEAGVGECDAVVPGELAGNEAGVGECDAVVPGELAGNEAGVGECDAVVPGELAGNEAWAGAIAVDWPAGGRGVEPPGPPQAAGASFEEWGADVAERFMSLT